MAAGGSCLSGGVQHAKTGTFVTLKSKGEHRKQQASHSNVIVCHGRIRRNFPQNTCSLTHFKGGSWLLGQKIPNEILCNLGILSHLSCHAWHGDLRILVFATWLGWPMCQKVKK